ncbi:MAG: AAA family ATPase [Anaerolineae bacterium]|nr:AAA family ATPase [Anaerolineae bacterium]
MATNESRLEEGYDLAALNKYDLTEDPFSLSANPRFVHLGESHKQVYQHAISLISRRRGLGLVMGGVGIGKSSLARLLFYNFFDRDDTIVAYVPSANWSTRTRAVKEVANALAELNVQTKRSYDGSLVSLSTAIAKAHRDDKKNIVLLLDESHLMNPEAFELVHELYNFDFDVKVVQVLMFGQPELDGLISSQAHLNSRVAIRLYLDPLTFPSALEMVNHRLLIAGRKFQLFDDDAFLALYNASSGVPRDIVATCSWCLDIILRDKKDRVDMDAVEEANQLRYRHISEGEAP